MVMLWILLVKIGYFFVKSVFDMLCDKMDLCKVNGVVFLGFNGIVIKSYGGIDVEGFVVVVEVGYDMVCNKLNEKIEYDLKNFYFRCFLVKVDVDDDGV